MAQAGPLPSLPVARPVSPETGENMQTDTTITTVSGRVVKCRPVSDTLVTLALAQIEKEYRGRGEPIDAPTYTLTIMLPGGEAGTETHTHDETTLEAPGDEALTKSNKIAWAEHLSAKERLLAAQNAKREYLWFMAGLDFEMPANDSWAQEQAELYGIEVPNEPAARKLHYIKTVILVSLEDIIRALETITTLSYSGLVDPEAVRASIKSFRNNLQGAAAARNPAAQKPMESQPAVQ